MVLVMVGEGGCGDGGVQSIAPKTHTLTPLQVFFLSVSISHNSEVKSYVW